MTLTFISIERYFAIVHPLRFRATVIRTRLTIGAIWACSCVLLLPEVIVLDVIHRWPHEFTRLLTVCRPSWAPSRQTAYQFVLLIVLYALPLVIMAFAYIQIARRLWTSLAIVELVPDSPRKYQCGSKWTSLAMATSAGQLGRRATFCTSVEVFVIEDHLKTKLSNIKSHRRIKSIVL